MNGRLGESVVHVYVRACIFVPSLDQFINHTARPHCILPYYVRVCVHGRLSVHAFLFAYLFASWTKP